MNIPTFVEAPAGWYRIMSGYNLQSMREAQLIAEDHVERTGQAVAYVHRSLTFAQGLPFHIYAKSS